MVSVGAGATLNINGVFDNTGTIWARGGVVNINGSLTGGATTISGNGQVWINQPSNENVSFGATSRVSCRFRLGIHRLDFWVRK